MGKSRISNNIRKLRFFHNEMTQQELADKVGVTRQTIIAMEQEKYSPSLELAFRIALALGCRWKKFSPTLPEITQTKQPEN
jgi:putative transcriptional regulator